MLRLSPAYLGRAFVFCGQLRGAIEPRPPRDSLIRNDGPSWLNCLVNEPEMGGVCGQWPTTSAASAVKLTDSVWPTPSAPRYGVFSTIRAKRWNSCAKHGHYRNACPMGSFCGTWELMNATTASKATAYPVCDGASRHSRSVSVRPSPLYLMIRSAFRFSRSNFARSLANRIAPKFVMSYRRGGCDAVGHLRARFSASNRPPNFDLNHWQSGRERI